MSKPIYIDWLAKDALDGMNQLQPLEELAYRRIIDMIYATDDDLLDDDESLKWATKTGAKWPKIKQRLLDMNKIEVVSGRISNEHCREKLAAAHARIAASSKAGKASAAKRKSKKSKKTYSTPVITPVGTDRATHLQPITNHQSPSLESKEDSKEILAQQFEEFFKGWRPYEMVRGNKQQAKKKYLEARKKATHEQIITARDAYLAQCHELKIKTQHACTWLHQKGWEENYDGVSAGTAETPEQRAAREATDAEMEAIRKGGSYGEPASL